MLLYLAYFVYYIKVIRQFEFFAEHLQPTKIPNKYNVAGDNRLSPDLQPPAA